MLDRGVPRAVAFELGPPPGSRDQLSPGRRDRLAICAVDIEERQEVQENGRRVERIAHETGERRPAMVVAAGDGEATRRVELGEPSEDDERADPVTRLGPRGDLDRGHRAERDAEERRLREGVPRRERLGEIERARQLVGRARADGEREVIAEVRRDDDEPTRREGATEAIHPRVVGALVVKALRDQVDADRLALARLVHAAARASSRRLICAGDVGRGQP